MKLEEVLGARCFCPAHGMKWNSEVGVWNSEIREKESFKIHNSPFRIPKSSLTHYSIIPLFHDSLRGVGPTGRRPIVNDAN